MHIEKLPSGATRVKVSTGQKNKNGRYIYETFTDMDEKRAVRMAAEYLDEHREKGSRSAFAYAMDNYITSSEKRLSPATVREYRARQRALLERYPEFCESQVSRITKRQVQNLINDMASYLSPKSIKNYNAFISTIIKSQDFRPPVVKLPEPRTPEVYVPEVEEVETLWKLAEGTDYQIPILLAAYGTLRVGEICALTLDDIQGNVIHVRRDMVADDQNRWHVKPPKKMQSDRYIPMPDWIIRKIDKGYTKRTRSDIIYDVDKNFPEGRYVSPFVPVCLSKAFVRWIEGYGEHITLHGLRHFAATDMSDAGIPEAYILARGGWKTDHVMKAHYRTTLQKKQDEVNKSLLERYNISRNTPEK